MPSRKRSPPAAMLLLVAVALSGGCQGLNMDEEIRFACDSNKRCSQKNHTCGLDGLCHPSKVRGFASLFDATDTSGEVHPAAYATSVAGSASRKAALAARERPGDHDCAKRCAKRLAGCTAGCEGRLKCREHCSRASDLCYSRCRNVNDALEVARQRRDEKLCMSEKGQMRRCTAAENEELNAEMARAAKMFCEDRHGEHVLCPEQREQLQKARRFIPAGYHGVGCDGAGQE
ncbi:hypothetical protein [Myxococcus sp. AM010]|uniref:hypothetical protein n=1 Tax=Myxococcus sp. AM010 TaxID=2745138 RepID=UPI0015957554|nr:hypothetical protein [Myxococcus sp. AM010]NVJ15833.1 hypothetical protein [Myxococcus sp. AM010]